MTNPQPIRFSGGPLDGERRKSDGLPPYYEACEAPKFSAARFDPSLDVSARCEVKRLLYRQSADDPHLYEFVDA